MFDYIKCLRKLPLNEDLKKLQVDWKEINFQTKDLENCMSEYFISKNGHLYEVVVEREWIPYTDEEIKKLKKDNKQKFITPFSNVIEKNKTNKRVNFHGKILFYETFELSETESIWVDFEAYFVYGKLDKIELVKVEKYKSNKFSLKEWMEKETKRQKTLKFRIKKYTGIFWIAKKVSRICTKLTSALNNISSFLSRVQNT